MPTITTTVVLPERDNPFFSKMSALLPKEVFNADQEFMIPRLGPVEIRGVVSPLATVKVFINGVDKSPVPDIVADEAGAWSGLFDLNQGSNTIQVQFFPPEIAQAVDNGYSPTLLVDNVLVHPTLFSRFSMENTLQALVLDGNFLYVGNYVPPPNGTETLARFDIATGASTVLDLGATTPTSGRVFVMTKDSNWLYVVQTMGDASIKVSRYAKDLSARTDITTYATVPNSIYADGTNVFVVRQGASNAGALLTKIDPATFTVIGSEINIKDGFLNESAISHNHPGDDGTHLLIPTSQFFFSEFTNELMPGSPDLGQIVFRHWFHRKVRKSDMANIGGRFTTVVEKDLFQASKNSLVRFGGFYYTLIQENPGKVVKLQEQVVNTLDMLVPVEVTPLPIDASDADGLSALVPKMILGPDSRIYVVGANGFARFTPGSNSISFVPRGKKSIDADLNNMVVIDDTAPTKALAAAISIFADRAQTFTVTAPTQAPTGVACHYNKTQSWVSVGWDKLNDGSAYIIEKSKNAGAFVEIGREFIGSGLFGGSSIMGEFHSGDTLTFRIKAFNSVGVGPASATADFAVPFLTPPLGNCANMVSTSVVGNSVTVQFEDNEIVVGGPINDTTNRYHVLSLERSADGIGGWTEVLVRSMLPSNSQTDGGQAGGAFYYNPSTRTNTLVSMTDNNAGAYPYYYRVRAEQKDGPSLGFGTFRYVSGGYSNVLQVDQPPSTPINVTQENAWEGELVTWAPGAGGGVVTGYTIKRSTNNGGSYSVLNTVGNVTKYLDTTAISQPGVRYKVFATGPGGSSPDSTESSQIIVFTEVKLDVSNIGPLMLDGSYAYTIATNAGSGADLVLTKINLLDSTDRTVNSSVYTKVGTFSAIYGGFILGGFLYVLIKDQGESFARILKIDPATLMQTATLALPTGAYLGNATGSHRLVTDGTNCWAVTKGSVFGEQAKVVSFDPVAMTTILVGPQIGSAYGAEATAFGGMLFVGGYNSLTLSSSVARIDTTTLAVAESLSLGTVVNSMTNDGTSVFVGNSQRISKFSPSPLTFVTETGDLGNSNGVNEMHVIGGAIYTVPRADSSSGGFSKVSTAPAFVSSLARSHGNFAANDCIKGDATYVYFSMGGQYVARELIASF